VGGFFLRLGSLMFYIFNVIYELQFFVIYPQEVTVEEKKFAMALADALASKKLLDAATKAAQAAQEDFDSKMEIVWPLVLAPCAKAIDAYNKDASIKVQSGFKISFGAEQKKVGLSIRLRWPSGHEPDEEFDFDDRKNIQDKLAPFVDAELEEAGIPFTLGEITVPIDYYSK
jgi:hypothetical protein